MIPLSDLNFSVVVSSVPQQAVFSPHWGAGGVLSFGRFCRPLRAADEPVSMHGRLRKNYRRAHCKSSGYVVFSKSLTRRYPSSLPWEDSHSAINGEDVWLGEIFRRFDAVAKQI